MGAVVAPAGGWGHTETQNGSGAGNTGAVGILGAMGVSQHESLARTHDRGCAPKNQGGA